MAVVGLTAACLLMLRHLPTGSRESLAERASWRSLGAFLPVLASGVSASPSLTPAFWRCCRSTGWIKG
jgi:predicted lysophospholipase L1 biosynthesis ABC-type transport system permease subunit